MRVWTPASGLCRQSCFLFGRGAYGVKTSPCIGRTYYTQNAISLWGGFLCGSVLSTLNWLELKETRDLYCDGHHGIIMEAWSWDIW